MTVHALTHAAFEGLGSIETWLRARGHAVEQTRLYAGERLPEGRSMDLLVVMGGPMSANDDGTVPWIASERRFIQEAIRGGVRALGVCLGAQLLAGALGARVYPNPHREIGWHPVHAVAAPEGTFRFPPIVPAFHWHGETFDLPEGAHHLAQSEGCRHQAFQVGTTVLGLQCHFEMTPQAVTALIEYCAHDLAPGPYVQAAEQMLCAPASDYHLANAQMDSALAYLVEGPPTSSGPVSG